MTYQAPAKEHDSDRQMRELKESQAATQLTPEEAAELASHDPSLTDAERISVLKSASVRSGGKIAHRVSYKNGEMIREEFSTHRSNSADPIPGVEGVLATITSPHGAHRASFDDVQPTDLVKVGGIPTTVENAVRIGLLVKGKDGSYAEPAPASPEEVAAKAAADAAKAEADAPIEALSPEIQQVVANLTEMVGSEAKATSVVTSVIAKGIGGDMKAAGAALARGTGIEPEQAEADASAAIADAVKSTGALLTARYGIDGAATLQHISETMPAGERAHLALALYRGDPKAFQRCAEVGRRLARAQAYPVKK